MTRLITEYHMLEYNSHAERVDKICSIFIVVNSIKMKKSIFELQEEGCCSRYYIFNDKKYTLS